MHELLLEREETTQGAAVCPMHATQKHSAQLTQEDELVLPRHKRVVAQYTTDASGLTELHLHYGDREISFDEPELFAFGESLSKQARFMAGAATAWGKGYAWPQIQELLEHLLAEGVLQRVAATDAELNSRGGVRPSLLPPAETTQARTWQEFPEIMQELTGRAVELAYLELIVPISRIAHIALDAEDRQVGEANVFPNQLRLDRPTEWRTCTYAGSRYLDPLPMNMTALKSMSQHWPQMMAALLPIRAAYLRRFPRAAKGWTVGDLQRLSTLVLTLPAYQLLRKAQPVQNGDLHPVLSCMFRVTDGLRMVTTQMLFLDQDDPALPPDAPVTSAEIYAYAERNEVFHASHGVCAGPKAMIEEFLSVLVDGKPIADHEAVVLDAAVQNALADLEPSFDYCLLGLQSHAVVFSLWPLMAKAYAQLSAILAAWPAQERTAATEALHARLRSSALDLQEASGVKVKAEYFFIRQRVYADMYAQSAHGLGAKAPSAELSAAIAPFNTAQHLQAADNLRSLLQQRLNPATAVNAALLDKFAGVLWDYLRQEQAIVRAGAETQQHINRLLGRTPCRQTIKAADLNLFYILIKDGPEEPYLVAELEEILSCRINVTPDSIEISALAVE